MKRKFILYPAVALALMTSASLSSCVDTDEPESLEALRNAKAEEVRANAGLINAKTAVENAYVAKVNADARYREAEAAYKEYEALIKKQEQELDAIKKKIEGDVNNAIAQQEIDKAKADWDKLIADAKASYEAANALYQKAIEDAKVTIQEAQLSDKVKLAQNAKEGVNQDLTTAYDKYVDALDKANKKLEEIQNFFAKKVSDGTFKRSTLEKDVITKKFALDKAIADTVNFAKAMSEKGIDAFGALYVEYQDKVNAVEAEKNKLNAKNKELQDVIDLDLQPAQNKTAQALTDAEKAYNDKKTALNEDYDKKIKALKEGKVEAGKLTFACSNTKLVNELIDASKIGDFKVTDKKDGYVNTAEIEGQKSEDAVKKLRETVNAVYVDLLNDYARKIQAMKDKAAIGLATATKEMNTSKTNWSNAVDKYRAKVTDDGLEADLIEKAKDLFGEYADNTKGGNWKWFSNKSAFTTDGATMKDLLKKAGVTNPEWGKMGKYGAYQSALEGSNTEMIDNVLDDAKKLLDAIDGKVNEYKNALKALEDGKKGIEGTDEMKKLAEAKTAAKTADDAAKAAVKAQKDKIQAEVTDELNKITNQETKNKNLATLYYGWANQLSSIVEGTEDMTNQQKTYLFNIYVGYAKEKLANNVAVAQDEYNLKKQDLDAFDAGTYDPDKALEGLNTEYETLQKKADDAKRTYDNLVEYYK
jgi:hypothetical protein